ncbi:molybdate ABC transporter permease subunit [Phenylobacterium sp.]|uniref:molybdate ABC transporter permease subunit n=1 Tax=Phenylobacterium sp. TaxID=1871053 RepID=UPI003783AED5
MDWEAFRVSLKLAGWTALVLLPLGLVLARGLAFRRVPAKGLWEALIAAPLVLPPTVLGFYLLTAMGANGAVGQAWAALAGRPLAFSFEGLLAASVIVNLPFAVQPMQRALEALPTDVRQAAWVSGLSPWSTFWRIELPLAWPGVLSAFALTFAHTLGEFGVVLMVGGSIPGETRTLALSIYDRVQGFDHAAAGAMSAALLAFSALTLAVVYGLGGRVGRRHG